MSPGANRPRLAASPASRTRSGRAGREPARDHVGDAARERDRRVLARGGVERHAPVLALGRLRRLRSAPRFRPGPAGRRGRPHAAAAARRRPSGRARPSRRRRRDRPPRARVGAERNDRCKPNEVESRAPPRGGGAPVRAASPRTFSARRPGTRRSTASRRRRRRTCVGARARLRRREIRRRACSRIAHCAADVSCASSTRIWSMPASSL